MSEDMRPTWLPTAQWLASTGSTHDPLHESSELNQDVTHVRQRDSLNSSSSFGGGKHVNLLTAVYSYDDLMDYLDRWQKILHKFSSTELSEGYVRNAVAA